MIIVADALHLEPAARAAYLADCATVVHLFRGSGPDEAQQAAILDADVREYPVTGSADRS